MKKCPSLLPIAYLIIFIPLSAHPDLIRSFKIINKNKIVVKAHKVLSKLFLKEDFFAEYDKSIDLTKLDESIVTIPFILSIIPVVWVSNKVYSISAMDKDLYYSLQKIKKVFKLFYPEQEWAGELIPQKLVTNIIISSTILDKPALAILFSGGLDSVDSSISHSDTKQLLITAWGSDVPLHKTSMWSGVFKRCQQFAQTYGHECISVKSNFKKFVENKGGVTQKNLKNKLHKVPGAWWLHTSQALSYAGFTAPILVERSIPTLLIGSSRTFKDPSPFGSHPALDNNIRFAGATVFHDGADKDRVQKVMRINAVCREKNLSLPKLLVCWNEDAFGGNCLKCGDKCLMTAGNIIAAGQLPQDYGIDVSVSEFIKRSKLFFETSGYLRKGILIHWECDLLYLDKFIEKTNINMFSDQEMQLFQEFLYSIDFEGLLGPNAFTYSPERQKQFELLWKKNTKKFFD